MEAELRIEDNEFIGIRVTGSVDIPNTVTRIGNCALKNQPITSINIPDSVKHVGDNVFSGCTSLARIRVPKHFDDKYVSYWGLPDTCEIVRD